MNTDTKEVPNEQYAIPCMFCIFVRVFAIAVFILTIIFYLFVKSQERAVAKKERAVVVATMQADMR